MAYLQYGKNILRRGSNEMLHHPLFHAAQGVRYRKLEVILTTTIDKLGKAGETVKAAPGAKIYQPKEVEEVKVVTKTEENSMKESQAAANLLANAKLVSRQLQVHIEPENLQLPTPLSALGEYKVPLRLPKSIRKPAGDEWILNVQIRKR